ncbi:TIGR03915 family putative DNA repair protein [Dethiothermospora halolimnae]|uniref:TIGR03915 family putative DNA repair protein n=1 Tax=Dethiothermospora halolimnae TaxID=3114390 RepID=UPI003CCBDA92
MVQYIYDGSFDGLLTAIYDSYYRREVPEKIHSEKSYQKNLLLGEVHIKTDKNKAEKVYKSIQSKISNQALKNVFYVFLSEVENGGKYIYDYLRFGWKVGKEVNNYLSDDRVLRIHKICKKINRERHLLLGLTRFRQLKGDIYYAPIEPTYNIIGLLADHFVDRLSDQNWVIHDVKRKIGVVYNREKWIIRDITLDREIILSESEEIYQKLWKKYFESIVIKEKINPKLQKQNMPMKYWHYLIEKE